MDARYLMLFRGMGLPSGPSCRRCSQPIHRSDQFGLSERACGPCRGEARGRPERRGMRRRRSTLFD
jgi:hypothetical protein